MKHTQYILTFLLALCTMQLWAEIRFRNGGSYRIRCIERPWGCIVPGSAMPESNGTPLAYCTDGASTGKEALWILERVEANYFTIRNAQSGLYLTFDGVRSSVRRYVRLSKSLHGDASLWKIYPGRTGLLILNKQRPDHLLNMRRESGIVGTYAGNNSSLATDNERFYLTDEKGRPVTNLNEGAINLPAICFDPNAKPTAGRPARRNSTPATLKFTIDKQEPVYDSRTKTYLCPIPERRFGKPFAATVKADGAQEGKIHVDGVAADRGGSCKFSAPEGGKRYRIALSNGTDTVAAAWVSFTFLPIVEISAQSLYKQAFSAGTFRLHDPDGKNGCETLLAKLRYRGDYSATFQKKSLAVKLTDENGRALDRQLLDMRTDNYWILDAMAIDRARMRNRVAMDLWNDFAARPYYAPKAPQALTGVRGRMVEVFMGGQYHGIYCLTERIDRKQTGILKPDAGQVRGCLYKSRQWGKWVQMGYDRYAGKLMRQPPPGFDNRSETWDNWEMKYPDPGKKQAGNWQPLYEAINFVGNTDDETFCRGVADRFDLPAVRDYWLFIELLLATDNSGKNMYWLAYDCKDSPKLTPAPWDLDATFGRDWDGHRGKCNPDKDFRRFLIERYSQSGLFERLYKLDPDGWNKELAARYRKLRKGAFDPDQLYKRFADYHKLLQRSGAEARERQRWNGANGVSLDFGTETEYLHNWIARRVNYLDEKYGYK